MRIKSFIEFIRRHLLLLLLTIIMTLSFAGPPKAYTYGVDGSSTTYVYYSESQDNTDPGTATEWTWTSNLTSTNGTEAGGFASASLNTGNLKASADVFSYAEADAFTPQSYSVALMLDNITFSETGTVTLRCTVDGFLYRESPDVYQDAWAHFYADFGMNTSSYAATYHEWRAKDGTDTETTSFNVSDVSEVFALTIDVIEGYEYRIYGLLSASVSYRGVAYSHLGNTAQFSLDVPEGMTWTSESGVFLTAVPEPATLLLLGFGLVYLAGLRKRIRIAS